MKTYKEKIKKVVDQIFCDCCGKSCTKQCDHEYAELNATWGYDSNQDGMQYDIQICKHCFDEVLAYVKKIRKKFLGPFKYPHDNDPLEGRSYFPS